MRPIPYDQHHLFFSLCGARGRGADEQTGVSAAHKPARADVSKGPNTGEERRCPCCIRSHMFFPPVSHRPEDPILFCIDELLNMYDGDDPELTFAGTEDEVAAASKIQAMNRGKLARKELQEQSDAATKMQAVQRGKAARKSIGGAEAGEPATADAGPEETAS